MTFKSTKNSHIAQSLAHRWYVIYESEITDKMIENQIDILSPNVKISSPNGVATNADEFIASLHRLPKNNRHSHHMKSFSFNEISENEGELAIDIVYQNENETGDLNAFKIHYDNKISFNGENWTFNEININIVEPVEITSFESAHHYNRVNSFAHYYLYLMEQLNGNAEPYKELFSTEGFEFVFSPNPPITSFEGFADWYMAIPNRIKKSSHRIENIDIKVENDNLYKVSIDMHWDSVTTDDQQMALDTRQECILEETGDRFPKIKEIKVVPADQ
ncbi:hypothetical protein LC087_13075 [Bacillus carboniphilus]|uniref:SnoaL-like domain-containing protein n=1 Tax=Bacillus carboniphilus TaxID=86663 RepID=A0ABY9JVR4_9BACI|nr:hypothetical protein [Bacillus carboniphilus]WLR41776.1 hypothetical protein LC087_13075 [Bacillus carboniphilus]